jgi:hypothetical protein
MADDDWASRVVFRDVLSAATRAASAFPSSVKTLSKQNRDYERRIASDRSPSGANPLEAAPGPRGQRP